MADPEMRELAEAEFYEQRDRVPALEPLEAEPDFRAAVARCRDWVRATSAKVPARAGR